MLITSELTNQNARKALFTCVVYTKKDTEQIKLFDQPCILKLFLFSLAQSGVLHESRTSLNGVLQEGRGGVSPLGCCL